MIEMLEFKKHLSKKTILTLRQVFDFQDGDIDNHYTKFMLEIEGCKKDIDPEFLLFCAEKRKIKRTKLDQSWSPNPLYFDIQGASESIKEEYISSFKMEYANYSLDSNLEALCINYCKLKWQFDYRNKETKNATTIDKKWEPSDDAKKVLREYWQSDLDYHIEIGVFVLNAVNSAAFSKDWDAKIVEYAKNKAV